MAPSAFGKKIGKRGCKAFSRDVRVVSSNPSVVPSDDEGVLTARSKGECEIHFLARNGNLSAPMFAGAQLADGWYLAPPTDSEVMY